MLRRKKRSFVGGAALLGIGAVLSKIIGAIYRVPLTNLLGLDGLGLYQMVFPLYTLLLDFSGAGVPSAISKIISSYPELERKEKAKEYLLGSLRLLFFLGVIASALMFFLSEKISYLQGDSRAALAYKSLAPAVLLVAVISCFRGYYQGLMNMAPTAVSQVIEQVVKLIAGILLIKALLPSVVNAVAGATLAITLSELVATVYLSILYRKRERRLPKLNQVFPHAKKIIKTSIPVTLAGILLPFSHVIDSFMIINVLSTYRQDATALFGVLSGAVATLINLPVSVCYGIATAIIPAVSSADSERAIRVNQKKAILITLLISIPCAVLYVFFSDVAVNLLFARMTASQKLLTVSLLKASAIEIVLLSLLQTLNGILIGRGRLYYPVISLGIGVAVKTVLNFILLKNEQLNIFASAIALIACYLVVCLVNLIMVLKNEDKECNNWRKANT
ncbi:MAG: polysaccharide biosynthesis protein [Clostridia bacterium]|nr:polysaccharide biosynthesis protein [Clostridia bacterium]